MSEGRRRAQARAGGGRVGGFGPRWLVGLALLFACSGEGEPATPVPQDQAAPAPAAPAPSAARTGGPAVAALTAGGNATFARFSHVCAALEGALQCWGANGLGQLGNGLPSVRAPFPVRVAGLPGPVTAIAAGGAHTCALADGRVHCWGHNGTRQLGAERPSMRVLPEVVGGLPEPATALAAGRRHTCAVAEGGLWCWGASESGELGFAPEARCRGVYGAHPCTATPHRVEGLPAPVDGVALGAGHSCALVAGQVFCWGDDARGQLGDGGGEARSSPGRVELPGTARAVAAGAEHSCALLDAGVWCWGANESGQLGDGSLDDRSRPVRSIDLAGPADRLAAGGSGTCVRIGGDVRCWGAALPGPESSPRPRRISGLGRASGALVVGEDVACAVVESARVRCWGDNDYGQLGDGSAPARPSTPVDAGPWDDGRIRDANRDGRITVACLGDSNTHRTSRDSPGWCERLEARLAEEHPGKLGWETINRGWGGASAVGGSLRPARQQLGYSLENDRPDVVVMAYGTNDLLGGASPGEVLLAYAQHRQRVLATGADFFVATTPPTLPATREVNAAIDALNALIVEGFPADRVIDFHDGVGPDEFVDDIHLGDAGHERRARAAAAALSAAAPVSEP